MAAKLAFGGMMLLLFGFSAGFYIDYRVVDKDTMFLPAYLVWALWLGVGYQWLLDRTHSIQRADWLTILEIRSLQAVMIGAVIIAIGWNWRLVDQSSDWSTRIRAETILQQVEPDALIFDWWDTVPAIEYLQLVESQRQDVQAINRFLIDQDDMVRLIQREIEQRPIYIDHPPTEMLHRWQAKPVGSLYRLETNRLQATTQVQHRTDSIQQGGDADQWNDFVNIRR